MSPPPVKTNPVTETHTRNIVAALLELSTEWSFEHRRWFHLAAIVPDVEARRVIMSAVCVYDGVPYDPCGEYERVDVGALMSFFATMLREDES